MRGAFVRAANAQIEYTRPAVIAITADRLYHAALLNHLDASMWAQSAAEIGKILVAAREYRKLTQTELGKAIGASQKWISEVEQGKETAQLGKVLRALSHLGVRLKTGATPWKAAPVKRQSDTTIRLSDIISANTTPLPHRRRK
jgi:y4mF family transcriptional regulator